MPPVRLAAILRAAGHDCAHVYDLDLGGQPDEQVMAVAEHDERILLSADTDFGELLANAPVLAPSVILIRRTDKRADPLAAVILANLSQLSDDLAAGALVVITDTRVRVRRLPVKSTDDQTTILPSRSFATPWLPPDRGAISGTRRRGGR